MNTLIDKIVIDVYFKSHFDRSGSFGSSHHKSNEISSISSSRLSFIMVYHRDLYWLLELYLLINALFFKQIFDLAA